MIKLRQIDERKVAHASEVSEVAEMLWGLEGLSAELSLQLVVRSPLLLVAQVEAEEDGSTLALVAELEAQEVALEAAVVEDQ